MNTIIIEILIYLIQPLQIYIAIGAICQIIFLLLPINLLAWTNDSISAMTYVLIQGVFSSIIFMIIPNCLFEKKICPFTIFYIFLISIILSCIKVIKTIPLEHSNIFIPDKDKQEDPYQINFVDCYNIKKHQELSEIRLKSSYAERRYKKIKEELLRVRQNKDQSILEEMIKEET